MLKAYIFLVHKNPGQLKRLLERLDDGNSHFYIHLDAKSDIGAFAELESFKQPKLTWVERVSANWAGYSLVQATLNAIYAIKKSGHTYEMINLLSGQDYPIKSNAAIDRFYQEAKHKVFIEYFALPNAKWGDGGGMHRINKYFLGLKFPNRYIGKLMNLLILFFPPVRKKLPYDFQPFGGSQWWTIDMVTLNYIVSFLDTHPKFIKYFKYSFYPDEIFFQTLLLNCSNEAISCKIVNDNRRLLYWKEFNDPHPETLTMVHWDNIRSSNAMFARKFDENNEVLNAIDNRILNS